MVVADHALPPSVNQEIPWDALDSMRKAYIPASCNPPDMTTMIPEKMSPAEACHLYGYILSLQNTSKSFVFTPIYYSVEDEVVYDSGEFPYMLVLSSDYNRRPFRRNSQ